MIFDKLIKKTNDKPFKKFNDGQIHWVDIESIHFKDTYKSTYAQKEAKVKLLEESLKHGYDSAYPLIVSEDGAVEEGNSRFTACLNVGIKSVPIIVKSFSSDSETVNWQRDRQGASRQLDDAEIYEQFIYYENLKKQKNAEDEDISGFSNQYLAEALNVSPRLVSTFRYIYEHSSEDELKVYLTDLKNGTATFNRIEKEIKQRLNPDPEAKSVTPKLTSSDIFKLGIKYACNELTHGEKISSLLEKNGLRAIIQGDQIVLTASEIASIEKFTK